MEKKIRLKPYYPAILICLVILVIAGSYFVYMKYLPSENLRQNQQQNPEHTIQPTSPAIPVPGSTQDPGSVCDPKTVDPRIPVPVDTSIPIQYPMPVIRHSLNESDSGKTIVLGKGDLFEINLRFAPGLAMRWTVPVSGCGLELVNDGNYYTGGDFWNNTGFYRARYRAVSSGTSAFNGKLVITPTEDPMGAPRFNLTVIVK
jgi:predicted secreted protein